MLLSTGEKPVHSEIIYPIGTGGRGEMNLRVQSVFVAFCLLLFADGAFAQWQQSAGTESLNMQSLLTAGNREFAGGATGAYLSTNRAASYARSNNGNDSTGPTRGFAFDSAYVYSCTSRGVFRSADNGATWTSKSNGMTNLLTSGILRAGLYLFVATPTGVFRSVDQADTWTAAGLASIDVRSLAAVRNTVFAGTGGSGIFKSEDWGASWTPVNTELTSSSFRALQSQGSVLFAGGEIGTGVFRTEDLGAHWSRLAGGLPAGSYRGFAGNDRVIVAGSFGGGVFYSIDSGDNWSAINSGLTDLTIFDLELNEEYIVAATNTQGVFRFPLSSLPIQNGATLTSGAGGAARTATPGVSAFLRSGYAVASVTSGPAPYGSAVFAASQNGTVVSEAAVPAVPPTTASRLFVEYARGVAAGPVRPGSAPVDINTGIAVVNRGAAASNITYTLRDMQGDIVADGHGTLAAGAHRACFLDQLTVLAPDFVLPEAFATTRWGSLELTSDQPVSVMSLRMTTNQRREALFTTVPVADLTQPPAAGPAFFPQVADGGGYTSTIILLNTSSSPQSGTLRFFSDEGSALTIGQAGGATASTFRYAIPAGGTSVFQTAGASEAAQTGSLQLTPDSGSATPSGAGILARTANGILITEAGVPSALPSIHARVYVDMSNGHESGLAISNPGATSLTVILTAYQSDGLTPAGSGAGFLVLPGNGHSAAFVAQWIAGLPANFKGVLDLAATTPFAALTLRALTNARQDFLITTFPVADLTRPAPSPPLVFPQFADGEGYRTEFILLGTGGTAVLTLSFFGDDGKTLP